MRLRRDIAMRKLVSEGNILPWGYGRAWWDHYRDYAICYPIPLNYLLGMVRKVYFFLAQGVNPTRLEVLMYENQVLRTRLKEAREAPRRVARGWTS